MKSVSSNSDVMATPAKQAEPSQEYEQPRYSRRDTLLTMTGVLMVMLLASLDQTIVSTAMQARAAASGPQGVALLNLAVEAVKTGLTQGIHNVFILSLALMVVGLIAVLFIREIPLRGSTRRAATPADEAVEDVSPEGNLAAMI